MKHIPTTSTAVEKIKARARALRSSHESLGQARDAAAIEAGYDHYHHVTHCHKGSGKAKDGDNNRLLSCVYRVIPALLEADPMYDTTMREAHSDMARSVGIDALQQHILRVHSEYGLDYFRTAIHDYLRQVEGSGFKVTTDAASLSRDLPMLSNIWISLRQPQQEKLHHTLIQHCFFKVYAGYRRSAADMGSNGHGYATSKGIADAMQELLFCTTPDQLALYIERVANSELPRSMNISMHTGSEDYESPSTNWSRFSSGVSMEMAGFIATLPFGFCHLWAAGLWKGQC